jgi:hypothetical protein
MKFYLLLTLVIITFATISAQAERHIYVADHDVRLVLKIKEDGTVLVCGSLVIEISHQQNFGE